AIVASVAISIVTAGAGASLMVVMMAGMLSSMASQTILTGSINMGTALKAGVISAVTAGLTQGALAGLNLGGAGISSIGDSISVGNWGAVQSSLGNYVGASLVRSAISAGVNTIAYGGSFGQAFANGLVRDGAAVGANAIGVTLPGIGADGASPGTILANAASHALLGCAAASLSGGDCAGGAVGGAASAIAAPLIRDKIYADSSVQNYGDDKIRQAITVGLATLVGGVTGVMLGTDATSAALAAQNESLNNATSGAKPVLVSVPVPVPGGAVAFVPLPGPPGPEGTSTPNNGPQKTDPLTNPLEVQNQNGNAITTPNNGPQGSVLTGTPASGPQGPTILGNPGCMLFPAICASLAAIAQIQDGLGSGSTSSTGNASAATPTGSRGGQLITSDGTVGVGGGRLTVPDGTNAPATIGGTDYSGHALDRMQAQGIPPTVVQDTINPAYGIGGKYPGTAAYYNPSNDLTVVVDSKSGKVITVDYGKIKQ
ncbi:DUF637 domain-containing protein, partial [Cupriavidus basilensis]|uniref:DUF637 domain-containing protein n=1 Tax=Cupriavidus basilensis TaxID=68895 RepID=UPI00157B3462